MNIEESIRLFRKSLDILREHKELSRSKVLVEFIKFFITNRTFIKKGHRLYFVKSALLTLKPIIRGNPPKNNFDNLLRVVVTQFQDRNNLDPDTFAYCNLWAELPDGSFDSFCRRNIFFRDGQ